ncbi:hypothetical protein SCHPADRAFT_924199 [Schizopora paradoxa]|uniref:Uncharacterized protein n=1 Tax=Schizopora paradoxa TaxID=27342 RepID=A0A0H2S6N7_9AGAM|nr:hypothetical protein SCHPADRAFT_924199 [Schizopora paradoxa]
MASTSYYSDVKVASSYDLEAARPSAPSKLNAQAHLMYFDPVADKEDDDELALGGYTKDTSFLCSLNSSCLCFNRPCGIFGTFLFSVIVTFVLLFCISSGNSPSISDERSFSDALKLSHCENAPHFFQNVNKVTYPIHLDDARKLSLRMKGDALGSLKIVRDERPTANPYLATIELSVRTNEKSLLDEVVVYDEVKNGSVWWLLTPNILESTDIDGDGLPIEPCMNYDIVLHIPAGLEKLHIVSHTATQVLISESSASTSSHQNILSSLYISIRSASESNLFASSHSTLSATRTAIQMSGGKITGSIALGALLQIDTQQGIVSTDLDVIQLPANVQSTPATLRTVSGPGKTALRVVRPSENSYAPINAEHRAQSELNLDYTKASLDGKVELEGALAGQLNDVSFSSFTDAEAFSNAGISTTGEDRLSVISLDSTRTGTHV